MRIDSNLVNASKQEWTERFLGGKVPVRVAVVQVRSQIKRMLDAGYTVKDVAEELNEWWQLADKKPGEKVTEAMIRRALGLIKNRKQEKTKTEKAKTDDTTASATTTEEKKQDDKADPKTPEVQKKKDEKAEETATTKPEKNITDTKSADAEKQQSSQAYDLSRVVVEWREDDKQVVISETKPIPTGTLIRVPSGSKAKVVMCKPIEYGPMMKKRSGLAVMYELVADVSAQNHGA